ncbi:MAG: hypothetical protein JSV09_02405, partial [Thermoplasmata archaeon]
MRVVVKSVIGHGFSVELQLKRSMRISRIKDVLCQGRKLEPDEICVTYDGTILNEEDRVDDLFDCEALTIIPRGITGAVDEQALIEEYRYLREQFPLVKMIDLMTYKG